VSKAERIARQTATMEAEYRALFVEALRHCASGQWGLFGQNNPPIRMRPAAVGELSDLADRINALRRKLGEAAFELLERYLAACGRHDENQVGEPKMAAIWLKDFEG
jgi:hypothetical protein